MLTEVLLVVPAPLASSTLKTLAAVLHENNRQRIELFGLTQTKQIQNDELFSFDPVDAARRGGLKI